mmetsp:Transcript_11096/g.24366  ORF Transcript_11096/g.24366 Transcript_11096/m.24366 type:complete len:210 (+) Transcript_11096:44-673(+)
MVILATLCPCRLRPKASASVPQVRSGQRPCGQVEVVADASLEADGQLESCNEGASKARQAEGELSAELLEEIKATFDLCDSDASGEIHAKELRMVMRNLGFKHSNEEVDLMIAQADDNGSGTIDFDQFRCMVVRKMTERKPRVEKAFEQFDPDGFGFITLQKLKRVARNLGEDLREEELQDMLDLADKDKDGVVSQNDFMIFMKERGMW